MAALGGIAVGLFGAWAMGWVSTSPWSASAADEVAAVGPVSAQFTLCHTGGGRYCVVDGDTIWVHNVKVRIVGLDAPETHPPRCDREADLGSRATRRLQALLNEGPFVLEANLNSDEDRYGRKLRRITRDGQSLGQILINEGLARAYGGERRSSWC